MKLYGGTCQFCVGGYGWADSPLTGMVQKAPAKEAKPLQPWSLPGGVVWHRVVSWAHQLPLKVKKWGEASQQVLVIPFEESR